MDDKDREILKLRHRIVELKLERDALLRRIRVRGRESERDDEEDEEESDEEEDSEKSHFQIF